MEKIIKEWEEKSQLVIDDSDNLYKHLSRECFDTYNNAKEKYGEKVAAKILKIGIRQFVDAIKFEY